MFKHIIDQEIELRLLDQKHAEIIFQSIDDSRHTLREWLPWVEGTQSIEDTKDFIHRTKQKFISNEGLDASIWYQGEFAGIIGYNGIDWSNRLTGIGYWLDHRFTGKGIMTKACKAFVNHAFHEYHLNRVEIRCAKENLKSRAIPERLGFSEEGMARQSEWLYDHYVDHVIYGLLAQDLPDRI